MQEAFFVVLSNLVITGFGYLAFILFFFFLKLCGFELFLRFRYIYWGVRVFRCDLLSFWCWDWVGCFGFQTHIMALAAFVVLWGVWVLHIYRSISRNFEGYLLLTSNSKQTSCSHTPPPCEPKQLVLPLVYIFADTAYSIARLLLA
jgi:hypothetical protein